MARVGAAAALAAVLALSLVPEGGKALSPYARVNSPRLAVMPHLARGGRDDFDTFDETEARSKAVVGGGLAALFPKKLTNYLLAGVFVLGIGTGVTVDSAINTNPKDLASRDAIDRAAPNPELCQQYGASAMVMDQRLFVTFNPFNIYVTQADTKPGCVLRPSNVVPVLQGRGLVDRDEIAACKNNMNTWGFVGTLDDRPQLSCVYKSQDAQNEFLSNPKIGLGEDVYDNDAPPVASNAKRVKQ